MTITSQKMLVSGRRVRRGKPKARRSEAGRKRRRRRTIVAM